jgi:hypothetical protein
MTLIVLAIAALFGLVLVALLVRRRSAVWDPSELRAHVARAGAGGEIVLQDEGARLSTGQSGVLLLLRDELCFFECMSKAEWRWPVPCVTDVELASDRSDPSALPMLRVQFRRDGIDESRAFRVSDPVTWHRKLREVVVLRRLDGFARRSQQAQAFI